METPGIELMLTFKERTMEALPRCVHLTDAERTFC